MPFRHPGAVNAKLSYQAAHCKTRARVRPGFRAAEEEHQRRNYGREARNDEIAIQRRLEISIVLILRKLGRFLIGMLCRLEM
jgi:hypothetical protein